MEGDVYFQCEYFEMVISRKKDGYFKFSFENQSFENLMSYTIAPLGTCVGNFFNAL
jgi:hypothetical protein